MSSFSEAADLNITAIFTRTSVRVVKTGAKFSQPHLHHTLTETGRSHIYIVVLQLNINKYVCVCETELCSQQPVSVCVPLNANELC